MALHFHRAVSDDGGAIGDEIYSGDAGALLPAISIDDQVNGVSVPRKLFVRNDGVSDEEILIMVESVSVFSAAMFMSSGDAQTTADLTGNETDEGIIQDVVPAGGHTSYWVRVDVPSGSSETRSYNAVNIKLIQKG